MFKTIVRTDDSLVQLLIRVALGVVILPHGLQKVFGWFGGTGFLKTLNAFAGMGFPAWSTVLLMGVESIGALLLIVGFLTRIWALGIGVAMTICVFKIHVHHGFFMNWFGQQKGEGFEYHILVLGIAVALLIKGGGMLSVDRSLSLHRRSNRRIYGR
jgi:putative oxidoreductase